jgi:hypothetical protein
MHTRMSGCRRSLQSFLHPIHVTAVSEDTIRDREDAGTPKQISTGALPRRSRQASQAASVRAKPLMEVAYDVTCRCSGRPWFVARREAITVRSVSERGARLQGGPGPPVRAAGQVSDRFDEPDVVDQEVGVVESAAGPVHQSGKGSEQIRRASLGVRPNVRSRASVTVSADSASSRAGWSWSS